MTISVTVGAVRSAQEHGFVYVRSPSVAVMSIVGQRDAPGTPLTAVLRACVDRLGPIVDRWLEALPQHRLMIFASTPFASIPNVIARQRGVWGLEELGWLPEGSPRSTLAEVRSDDGVRFAGIAEVTTKTLYAAADFVRGHSSSVLFLSARGGMTEEQVRLVFNVAFPSGESGVSWPSLADCASASQDVYIRVFGGFDDREVAVDALMSAQTMNALESGCGEGT
jgi:hypothetical protein